MQRTPLAVLAVAAVLVLSGTGNAANGDNLAQFVADRGVGNACASSDASGNHGGSIGTGIAFNGANLLLTCWYSNQVAEVSAANGAYVGTATIAGATNLGAIAWDAGRGGAWVCESFSQVGFIDFTTSTYTPAFASQGCVDGLAYDGADDTIWASGDVAGQVQHYSISGALLGSFPVSLGGNGNSGIAVGGPMLYLANNGGSQIYEVAKDFSTSTLFASFPRRLEDLECDNVTFGSGPTPKAAIWSVDAYDNILNAWEIPDGACLFGGGRSSLTLTPATATNDVFSSHTVVANLTDRLGPVAGASILFSVSGANTASGSGSTDAAGDAPFSYTGTSAGTDTITACYDKNLNGACDGDEPTATATKQWVNRYALDLAPPTATNTVGSSHTVTATFTNGGRPVSGTTILFSASGANAASGSGSTDAAGQAPFSYVGGSVGSDAISACADVNRNGSCDPGEPTAAAAKRWVDDVAPTAACLQTTNPSGSNVPTAGPGAGKSGQNPDGFYVISAKDNYDARAVVFVKDAATGIVFGPYASQTKIKLTQAPGVTPNAKPGAGDIDWKIQIRGDALVYSIDASGNTSAAQSCKVPPPPK